jgi:pyruvate,water dikinase
MSNAKEIICFYEDGRIHLVPPKIRPTFNLLKMPLHIIKSARTNIAPWDSLRDKIDALLSRVEGMKTKESTPKELGKILSELFQKAKEINELRFFYILEASLLPITILSTLLKGSTARKLNITSIEAFTIGLDYKTAVIDRELQRLAVYAHSKPEIKELILIEEFTDFQGFVNQLTQLPEGREFLCRFHEFLRQYGSRTEKMYHPFTSKAWVEDPLYFLNILKATIQDEYLTLREQREQERRVEFNQRMENLEKKLISPVRKLFRWSIRQLRDSYVLREDTVFYLEKLFTAGRGLVKEIGKNLVREGLLENKEDIIYLRESEIYRLLEGQPFEKDSKVLVQIRKEIVSSNQKIWKQNLFNLSGPQGDSDSIEGVMGSPGIAEGPVCVIQRVEDFGKLKKGDILVCPYTDPAWTPLFGLAAGVVSDTGGPLSHAAIVAREYGIPAILGTKVATTYLQDGEVVLVDGGNGKVYKKMEFLITG